MLVLLSGCGQKGGLYLPNDPDFKQRATLPDIVRRQFPDWPADAPAQKPKPAASAASANVTSAAPAGAASAAAPTASAPAAAPSASGNASPVTPATPSSDNTSTPATPTAR